MEIPDTEAEVPDFRSAQHQRPRGIDAQAARQGLFFLPLIWILPQFFGLLGVQMCQTVSDVLTFSLSVPLCLSVLKELK